MSRRAGISCGTSTACTRPSTPACAAARHSGRIAEARRGEGVRDSQVRHHAFVDVLSEVLAAQHSRACRSINAVRRSTCGYSGSSKLTVAARTVECSAWCLAPSAAAPADVVQRGMGWGGVRPSPSPNLPIQVVACACCMPRPRPHPSHAPVHMACPRMPPTVTPKTSAAAASPAGAGSSGEGEAEARAATAVEMPAGSPESEAQARAAGAAPPEGWRGAPRSGVQDALAGRHGRQRAHRWWRSGCGRPTQPGR